MCRCTIVALAALAWGLGAMNHAAAASSLKLEEGKSLSCLFDGKTLWQLHFRKEEGKPYFHPVCLPDGTELTWLRPPDHVWHRALWFSWKLINGLNYWEEDKEGKSQGLTEIANVDFEDGKDGAAKIVMLLDYRRPGEPRELASHCTIAVTAPDKDGAYRMDWRTTWTAQDKDVVFDRTPPPAEKGPSFGGYAGLSYRAVKGMTDYQTLDSEGRRNMAGHGQHARWLDFSGLVGPEKKAVGVAMFDHPSNPRHPSPWYIIMSGAFGYFSPAFLFDKPFTLPAGQSLTLAYRVLIHPGRGDRESLEKEFKDFAAAR